MRIRHLFLTGLFLLAVVFSVQAGELNIYIWEEYIDPALVKNFETQTGIKLNFEHYGSNEEMLKGLKDGGIGKYDIAVPSDYIISDLIEKKMIQPLDHAKLPNMANLDPTFGNPSFDPGNRYSVAYLWGTDGMIYRKDLIKNFEPTWALIFNPDRQPGPFYLLDSQAEMLAIASHYLGSSFNTTNPAEIKKTGAVIGEAKKTKNFKGFASGTTCREKVISGEAAISITYSGDALSASEKNPNIGFVIPKEGGILWVDSMVIPSKAPNSETAHQFINYMLEAINGAMLANFTRYATPNQAALPYILPTDMSNPIIYPSIEERKRLKFIEKPPVETQRMFDKIWKEIR